MESSDPGVQVRSAQRADRPWIVDLARRRLGSEHQVHSRRQFTVDEHDALIAEVHGRPAGFLAWIVDGSDCEVLAIATDHGRAGIGSALIAAVDHIALRSGCTRLVLTTTDANTGAQRFYEAVGFTLAERLVGAVDRCRERFKPEIPADMHDELVYERGLG
jgi:ribosomal protein S18 acetylase RimI-like enzyme